MSTGYWQRQIAFGPKPIRYRHRTSWLYKLGTGLGLVACLGVFLFEAGIVLTTLRLIWWAL